MVKMYSVSLTDAERQVLTETARDSGAPNRFATRARILLVAFVGDQGPAWPDTVIAEAFALSVPTVERRRCTSYERLIRPRGDIALVLARVVPRV
jgi:hypothetical protein